MKEKSELHLVEYGVLLILTLLMAGLFYYFRFNHAVLVFLSAVASVAYVTWGIVHHYIEDRLTKFIAAEYIVFGVLVFLLLYTVLNF